MKHAYLVRQLLIRQTWESIAPILQSRSDLVQSLPAFEHTYVVIGELWNSVGTDTDTLGIHSVLASLSLRLFGREILESHAKELLGLASKIEADPPDVAVT